MHIKKTDQYIPLSHFSLAKCKRISTDFSYIQQVNNVCIFRVSLLLRVFFGPSLLCHLNYVSKCNRVSSMDLAYNIVCTTININTLSNIVHGEMHLIHSSIALLSHIRSAIRNIILFTVPLKMICVYRIRNLYQWMLFFFYISK